VQVVSRILRLTLLAPDIIDTVLEGRSGQALMLERLERPLPVGWEEQRAQISRQTRRERFGRATYHP
jgi:hypothetical protein